jgi:hypothetical protein
MTKPTQSVYRAVPRPIHTGNTGAECLDCDFTWNGDATFANATNAARSHTQRTGHATHWGEERSGGFKGKPK